MFESIIKLIMEGLAKLLPFLFAYKAGSSSVEKKVLTETLEEVKVRNEVEHENDGLDRSDIVDRLRKLDGQ